MNRTDLQQLADVRIAEAAALLAAAPPLPDGAYYLAGYAVECGLKACIAKAFREHDWPDRKLVVDAHTHDLQTLVRLAGLATALREREATGDGFDKNWDVVKVWNERARYERHATQKAAELVSAVGHPSLGVLEWIKTHW